MNKTEANSVKGLLNRLRVRLSVLGLIRFAVKTALLTGVVVQMLCVMVFVLLNKELVMLVMVLVCLFLDKLCF